MLTLLTGYTSYVYGENNITSRIYKIINNLIGGKLYTEKDNRWTAIDDGIDYKSILFYRNDPSVKVILKLLRFSTKIYYPKVILAKNFNIKDFDVKTLTEETGAIAMINASYFDTDNKPLGYLMIDNNVINKKIAKNIIYSGFFIIKNNMPYIIHRQDFFPEGVTSAIQAGPRLIGNSTRTWGISFIDSIDFRSGIAIDKKNRLVLYITETKGNGLRLKEVQNILLRPDMACINAMNLDGGSSSQLYYRTKRMTEYIEGSASIPVAIGLFKKTH